MTVLITGSGLIGSQIARQLVERGERPIILELAPQTEAVGDIVDISKIKITQGDVLAPLDLTRVIRNEKITRIIHTAANPMLTVGAQQNPYPAVMLNVIGTMNILEAARTFGVERVVLCSSGVLYRSRLGGEDAGSVMKEEAFPRPTTFYSVSKQASEDLGLNYARWFGLDVRAVRFSAAFGPWRGRGGGGGITVQFRDLVEGSLTGKPIILPSARMEVVYSKDAADGAVRALDVDETASRVFNIGMGESYSFEEVADITRRVIPGANIEVESSSELMAGMATDEDLIMDLTRSSAELGYDPQFKMEAALRDYTEFTSAKL
jgi:nucleoside-diphosphate-sugar epimerase